MSTHNLDNDLDKALYRESRVYAQYPEIIPGSWISLALVIGVMWLFS